ncbi:MAG: S49 family peptidase [Polyangiaceae bacterium]|nr:S49 family peptidase [Polyangiaceae bacterium]
MKRPASALVLALLAIGCRGRTPQERVVGKREPRTGTSVAVLDLSAGVTERPASSAFGLPIHAKTYLDFQDAVKKIQENTSVRGVFVRFGSIGLPLSKSEEIAKLVAPLREKMPVACHADIYSNATIFLASQICSHVTLSPGSELESIGLASQMMYARTLLQDHLHLDLDVLQIGKYKGAEEPIVRDGPSPEARASLEGVLADFRTHWRDGIAAGRKKDLRDVAEDGPYSPDRAKELGLIDEVRYADDAKNDLRTKVSAVRDEIYFGPKSSDERGLPVSQVFELLAGDSAGPSPVALIVAKGSISMAGGGTFSSDGISEKSLSALLLKAERDESIKAVVLRIDSPGGSALASDLLWHRVTSLRAKKPVVVSVGEMAASGGYYIASAANAIFANATSLLGSIGVVGGKVGFGKALERIGVHTETFSGKPSDPKLGTRGAYNSNVSSWDDPTRERVRETMQGIYTLFLKRISEGRAVPVETVALSAEGKIFSGTEAKKRGLIDQIGGLPEAIQKARELAKLDADAEVHLLEPPASFPAFLGGGGGEPNESMARLALEMSRSLAPLEVIEAFEQISSLEPLCKGERVVVAMPFVWAVR